MAAGALFFDANDRVLVVRPSYKPGWDIPGGHIEPGESPRQACVREVHEELGIRPPIGTLLVVDWAPLAGEGDKVAFVFDGGLLSADHEAEIRIDPVEVVEWRFETPDVFSDLMPARLVRRLDTALKARGQGGTAYAEHGRLRR